MKAVSTTALPIAMCACLACGPPSTAPVIPATSPDDAALALFDLARDVEPDRESLALVVSPALFRDEPERLLDALARIGEVGDLRVLSSERLAEESGWVVDLECTRPGPTRLEYTVQVGRADDATWRVTWFAGPGVEWPRPRRGSDGLTTSPPPDGRD